MRLALPLALAALSALPLGALAQTTITSSALGFPVPQPVPTTTMGAWFRTAEALRLRYDELWLASTFITRSQVGSSQKGRHIIAYRFAPPRGTTPEGLPLAAAVLQGTIHSREWASPETIAGVFEWLALRGATDPVCLYVQENYEIVFSPLANPDGFAVTQANYNRVVGGSSTGNSGLDGRMRRKNLRGADETLTTTTDSALGVDLNRNHAVGFGGGSGSTSGETYRGPSAGSEPESQAFYAGLALLNAARIRIGLDYHSAQQTFYTMYTGQGTRDTTAQQNVAILQAATQASRGTFYDEIPTSVPQEAIGATDEYLSGTYGALAYTVELPTGGSPNGFILPESQVEAVRAEITAGTRAALYHMGGPAALVGVELSHAGVVVHRERRTIASTAARVRSLEATPGVSSPGTYTLKLTFNKPMRERTPGGAIGLLAGITAAATFTASLGGQPVNGAVWQFDSGFSVYPGDTVVGTVTLPAVTAGTPLALSVQAVDMVGVAIDGNPLTVVDWSAQGWQRLESGADTATAIVPVATRPAGWLIH